LALFHNPDFDTENWNQLFALPLDQICDEYSSGMKKKLALMGVLKQEKPLLILDEPFNNLDIETNRILRALLLKMKSRGTTIIITSHIIETLTNLCDNIHYLEQGKIKYSKDKTKFSAFEHEIFESIERKTQSTIDKLFD
jgi:ABC-2 type transport system ATP-binding protein